MNRTVDSEYPARRDSDSLRTDTNRRDDNKYALMWERLKNPKVYGTVLAIVLCLILHPVVLPAVLGGISTGFHPIRAVLHRGRLHLGSPDGVAGAAVCDLPVVGVDLRAGAGAAEGADPGAHAEVPAVAGDHGPDGEQLEGGRQAQRPHVLHPHALRHARVPLLGHRVHVPQLRGLLRARHDRPHLPEPRRGQRARGLRGAGQGEPERAGVHGAGARGGGDGGVDLVRGRGDAADHGRAVRRGQ
eukprot:1005883-Rhodomonas_salina.2